MPKTRNGRLTLKQRRWLKYYFETGNQTEAARKARYNCKEDSEFRTIGSENYAKLNHLIEQWYDEHELSNAALKKKLIEGLDAKKKIFISNGNKETIEKEVDDFFIRKGYLDIAFRVKGGYAPTKVESEIKETSVSIEELENENKRLEEMLKKMDDKDRNTNKVK